MRDSVPPWAGLEGLEGEAAEGGGQVGTDTALGCSQLKTQVQTQTENPIWNKILTFRIQVLPSHHASHMGGTMECWCV